MQSLARQLRASQSLSFSLSLSSLNHFHFFVSWLTMLLPIAVDLISA